LWLSVKNWSNGMSRLKFSAIILVIGTTWLGVPAVAAPVTPLSAAAKPVAQESDLTQARWHGWRGGHAVRYRCRPYCGWGG